MVIQEFDPEVFKQLVEYIHTGSVTLQSRTLLGLMNAADHYGLEELKLASIEFLERAINTDTVCSLLASAEKYIQYKSTKILVQKMLEYVDRNAEVVLNQLAFPSSHSMLSDWYFVVKNCKLARRPSLKHPSSGLCVTSMTTAILI